MEEPQLKSVKPYLMLTIQTDAGLEITKLVLKGPKLPDVKESPTIGYYFQDGKYVFKVGGGETAFDPAHLSRDFKAFLDGNHKERANNGPVSFRMPSKTDLRRTDGSYKSFESYELEVRLRAYSATQADLFYSSRFPKLPKEIYQELIRHYLFEEGNPLYFFV
jgi:hypothetical protein